MAGYRTCKVCGVSTYKPKPRIYTKYCGMECRNADPEYWEAISKTHKGKTLSEDHKTKLSESMKDYFKINPKAKAILNDSYKRYYFDCMFSFNLADFPEEFDLVKQHGWYSATNKGGNLDGVSRDHKISVKYGYKNDIPSEHIRHPANCRLITQRQNSSKRDKCLITYEQLLEQIHEWNIKYK